MLIMYITNMILTVMTKILMTRWGPGVTREGLEAALDEARSIFILDPTIKVLHANHYNTKNDNYPELRTLNLTMFQVRIYLEAGTHTISFLQPGDSIQLLGPGIKSNKKRIHTNQMCQMMKEKEDVF